MRSKMKLVRRTLTAGLAAVLFASCGGGDQIEAFVPGRIVSFGDEASYIETTGQKYNVNGVEFNTTVTPAVPVVPTVELCAANQIWNQQLAYNFNLAFNDRCEGTNASANGVMAAASGARAADLTQQVSTFVASADGPFRSNDLVTVMVGTHDIIDAYENAADPVAAVEQAGRQVGDEVIRITDGGARVIVSTIPNVGFTPYARRQALTDPGAVATLTDLSTRFNTQLRLRLQYVRGGGHMVGLVLADELVLAMTRYPATYGVANLADPACPAGSAPALPGCNAVHVAAAASAASVPTVTYGADYLWADDLRLGPNAQGRLGGLAVTRARNNPF